MVDYRYFSQNDNMAQRYSYPEKSGSRAVSLTTLVVLLVVVAVLSSALTIGFTISTNILDDIGVIFQTRSPAATPTTRKTLNPSVTFGSTKGTIIDPENPVVSIAENIGKCVVGVNNKVIAGKNPFGSSVPQLQGTGSGVIIGEDGYIITNNHVIAGADVITIVFNDTNEEVEAELIGKDSRTDLALLKIDRSGLTAIEFAKKEEIRVGELAIAIGNSLGESGSVTTGVVSAIDRSVNIDGVQSVMIQTDAAINPGNSGGALVNARGQLIGINTMKRLTTIDQGGQPITIEGVGYAIPIDVVEDIALKLLRDGRVIRAGLGITCLYIQADEQRRTPAGVYVQSVAKDAAAYNAGIRAEDVIVSIEGEQLTSLKHLSDFLAEHAPGDKVNMTIYKNGIYQDITVTLTELIEE